MGGFMPTPAAPSQPPPVKLDATATSRGNFNSFLKNLNGATPPPLAPMGAMMPQVAPSSMSDIDIFNTPVQFMFSGGEVDDFSDFGGFDDSSDPFGGSSDLSDPSIGDDNSSFNEQNFQDALDNLNLGSDDSMFSDDPSSATPMGLEMPSTQNFSTKGTTGSNANFLTTDQLADIKKNINMDNEKILSEDDSLFENNNLTPAGQAELDKMNAETLQLVTSGEIPASRFISAGSSSDILGDADVRAGVGLDKNIDLFENIIDRNFQNTGLVGANLPTIGSARSTVAEDQARALANLVPSIDTTVSDSLQQNVKEQQEALAAQRGRALGPITFGDDLANFQERLEPFESSRVGDDFDTALNIADRNEADRLAAGQAMGVGTAPNLQNLTSTAMGREIRPTSTRRDGLSEGEIDQDESIRTMSPGESRARFGGGLGEIVSGLEDGFQKDIVDLATRNPSINVSGILGKALNLPETFTRDRMVDALTTNRGKRLFGGTYEPTPIYQDGRIVGVRDQFGNLMEGIDPFAPDTGSNENEDPIIRPIIPIKKKEEEVKDKPPNIIGGMPIASAPATPTVVDSPFAPATSKIEPVTFDSGELNKLIELLTGVSAKPVVSAAEGGLIRAVDDFLAIGR
jgi:hypothetical protein